MRKLRLMAVAAILALSAVAISRAAVKSSKDITTFYYVGPAENPSQQDLNTPSNYTTTKPAGYDCTGSSTVCSIEDNPSSADPDQPALDMGTVVNQQGGAYIATQRDLD